jgi:hypothetical protein
MLWYIECEHQANCITTCETMDCRGERDEVANAMEVPGRAAANDLAMMATLMPTPRSLHDLWQEFHHGVGGRKAARLFSSYPERGRSKDRYHRHKKVWDLVSSLV